MNGKTFYGPLEVEYVTSLDESTVELQFVGGTTEIIPKKTFELSITQEKKDYNYLQEVKFEAMAKEIMAIIISYDLKMYEANSLLKKLGDTVNHIYGRAMNFLWTGDDKKFIVGSDPTDFFTLAEAEKVIARIPKEEPIKTDEQPATQGE